MTGTEAGFSGAMGAGVHASKTKACRLAEVITDRKSFSGTLVDCIQVQATPPPKFPSNSEVARRRTNNPTAVRQHKMTLCPPKSCVGPSQCISVRDRQNDDELTVVRGIMRKTGPEFLSGYDRRRGFSLVEMVTVVAIISVAAAIAIPSFSALRESHRLTTATNDLIADLMTARSESATRGRRVSLCASNDQATCSGDSWIDGRIIFVDVDGDRVRDPGEGLIRFSGPVEGVFSISATGFPDDDAITYQPYGGLQPAAAGSFKLCADGAVGRQVAVDYTGRAVASRPACP